MFTKNYYVYVLYLGNTQYYINHNLYRLALNALIPLASQYKKNYYY